MPSEYKIAKGDLFLQSKHADAAFRGDDGLALYFFNEPKKGKCLCVEYNRENWPAAYVTVQANWKAKKQIARYRKEEARWKEGLF